MIKKRIKKTSQIALYWYGMQPIGFLDFQEANSTMPEEWRDLDRTSADLLRKVGINWQKITSKEITNGNLLKLNFKILIVPSVYTLPKEEVEHIKGFTDNGGKIFGICTAVSTNILRDGVYFNRYFWLAPDRVALAKNIVNYLLKNEYRKVKHLPEPKSKDKTGLGYWGPLGLPLDIDILKNHSLSPDVLIGSVGMHRKGDIEGVSYLSSSDLIEFGEKLKNMKIPFYFAALGNSQIERVYADAKSSGKAVLPYSSEVIRKIKKISGRYFQGSILPDEPGTAQIGWKNFFADARDMQEAKEKYVKGVKKVTDENRNLGIPSLVSFEHSSLHRYNYEAGVDFDHAEIFYGGNVNVQLSSIRGSAKAYRKPWASNISIWVGSGDYVGCLHSSPDVLKLSFYLSYLYGSNPIIFQADGVSLGAGTIMGKGTARKSIQSEYEMVYQDFYRFTSMHPYLDVPKVKIGFLQGNLDAWHNVNLEASHNIGQGEGVWGLGKIRKWEKDKYGRWEFALKGTRPEWMYHDPEFGWDYLSVFYPGYTNRENQDKYFSPTPYGQIDITPIEAPLDVLEQYEFLILTGWNTITARIYQKLKNYCEQGGHLFLSIPHLSTHTKREDAINGNYTLLKKGDFSDFLGVKVKGKGERTRKIGLRQNSDYNFSVNNTYFAEGITLAKTDLTSAEIVADSPQGPVLIENNVVKGKVFLLTTWNYPGAKGLHQFMEDLIKCIAIKHQREVRVIGSQKIAYGIYQKKGERIIHLLNVSKNPQKFVLQVKRKEIPIRIKGRDVSILNI